MRNIGLARLLGVGVLLVGCGSGSSNHAAPSGSPSVQSGVFTANGHQLYLDCTGSGSPTMVIEVGEGRLRSDLAKVQEAYAHRVRVCTYDRANKGDSGRASTPRKGVDVLKDLHELLAAARVPGPYLLLGHSAGGLIAQAYAATYPDDVAGLVAINPVAPWQPWLSVMNRMTPSDRADEVAFLTGKNGESLDYRDISRSLEGNLPTGIPSYLLVSSPAECPPGDAACRKLIAQYDAVMKEIAHQWGDPPFRVIDASHDMQLDHFEAITTAVDSVLQRVRTQ